MALPFPIKVVLPFDIATAQDMNERHANDVALAAGTGLDDGAVTPSKRGGGFKIGVIPQGTFSTTGNKAITGVGFKPKLIKFYPLYTSNNSTNNLSIGSATSTDQFLISSINSGGTSGRLSSTTRCIGFMVSTSSYGILASLVSMDVDGFTINVIAAGASFDFAYEAFA